MVLFLSATVAAQEVSVANGIGYGTVGIYARTFGTVIVKSGTAIILLRQSHVASIDHEGLAGPMQRYTREDTSHPHHAFARDDGAVFQQ
jgi:hypothetical protein